MHNKLNSHEESRCLMQRDTIVYFGIIQFEYNNAMCQHAIGIAKLIEEIGYRPVVIGVSPSVNRGDFKRLDENTFAINEPQNAVEQIKECVCSKEIKNVLHEIGLERIKTFIMADFRFLSMKSIEQYCRQNGIYFAVDIMDRFVSRKSLVSKIKKIDCDLRMNLFYPKVERRIYICSAYNSLIGVGRHTAVIPGVTCKQSDKVINSITGSESTIQLVFLGRPGAKCEKEKIDWIIKCIYEEKLSSIFKVYLAGFDMDEFIKNNEHLNPYISKSIVFCGRITHDECIHLLENSDFSLVIRPDTILSKYGFSTKIGEAFSCGIPVLATDTSDNKLYIINGQNGFVCGCTYDDIRQLLIEVSKMTRQEINRMKRNCIKENPLIYSNYVQQFRKVVIEE